MMKAKDIIIFVLLITCFALVIEVRMTRIKTGMVRSTYLVDNYKGMMEARKLLSQKEQEYQKVSDSLTNLYMSGMALLNSDSVHFSTDEKNKASLNLQRLSTEINKVKEYKMQKSVEDQENMVMGIINQMNTNIKQYGEENGIDIILGTTDAGGVLHCSDEYDITDDVLNYINNKYMDE